MEQIAQQLVNQIVEEKQVYLDNARLKHGVPRHKGSPATGVAMPSQNEPGEQPAESPSPAQAIEATSKKTGGSFLKTAATIGLAAAAGAVGIPPIVTSIAGSLFSNAGESAPKEPSGGSAPTEEWNDLVNWIREEKLNQ